MTTGNQVLDISTVYTTTQLKEAKKAQLQTLADKAQTAKDTPITDKTSYRLVHETQIALRDERIAIEKGRKEFTANLDERKKSAIEIERELTSIISPIEEELKAKKEEYEKEQEKIKEEEERKKAEVLQDRIRELDSYEAPYNIALIQNMSDEGFRFLADDFKKKFEEIKRQREEEAEIKRKEEEESEKKRQEEAEALRKQKEEQDKIAKEQEEKAQEFARREKAIKDKEDEQKRQEELEKARKEGEEKAKKEEAERIERERIEKEQKEKEEKDKIEKEEAYKKWFAYNGVTTENREDYLTKTIGNKVFLFKKIAEYNLPE